MWSTIRRFLLARNIKHQNQKLIFDDDIIKCLSEIHKSCYKSRHPCRGKPSKNIFTLWTWLEVAVAGPEHQTTSILFIFGVLTKWYFLLLLLALDLSSLKTVSPALPGNSIRCLSSNCSARDMWRTCHKGFVFFVVCKLLLLFSSAMLTVTIVAVVALSIGPLTPALVSKTLQFAFVAHTLQ